MSSRLFNFINTQKHGTAHEFYEAMQSKKPKNIMLFKVQSTFGSHLFLTSTKVSKLTGI
jgi:hypothetical protein